MLGMKTRESMASLNICGRVLTKLQRIMATILQEINGDSFSVGPVNGRFLKHYLAS
jgi:hypothetical protein